MQFEYDTNKSDTNAVKHGIDFIKAQRLWSDSNLLMVELNFIDESRYLCIGKIDSKYYSAIITYRGDAIRIISVRRARKEEIYHYENEC